MGKDISKMITRLAKLQKKIKEVKKEFYVKFGVEIEKLLENNEDIDLNKIKTIYEKTKKEYGL